ncbi:hypothetical protein LKO27_09595 [Tessaracoccus sp. OS52]|uniref:hypothetical protein n=1 Tax=Tessaracoccus sp. OS52 TaxID=2886691 RepID=UPI001D119AD4|nr:hypothetical protein [Tessaracoccus sp. OS52]MCC2593656.1 hypothetical protein [Tessaracoccus sp. OS52]
MEAAIRADDAEAESFWTDLLRLAKHNVNFFSERSRFNAQARRIKGEAMGALEVVENLCETGIEVHREVPGDLEGDARDWQGRTRDVLRIRLRAEKLRAIAGWQGAASEEYTAAVTVQINALKELEGVMISTAEGCQAGAELNQGIFFLVAEAIKGATNDIRGASGGRGGQYYVRTAVARNECLELAKAIAQAVGGEAAAGSVAVLSKQLEQTVELPNLLEPGQWPTGTSAADTIPANTGAGVRGGGRVDNPKPGAGSRPTTGVNL